VGLAAVLVPGEIIAGVPPPLASPEQAHLLLRPGSHASLRSLAERGMPARRAIAPTATVRGRQRADIGDLAEERVLDPLDHQLGDAVTTPQHDRLTQVVVDQTDLDLAAIARVDRARRVYHGKDR